MNKLWKNLFNFFMIFLIISYVLTCSFLIFAHSVNIEREVMISGTKYIFVNIIVLTVTIFAAIKIYQKIRNAHEKKIHEKDTKDYLASVSHELKTPLAIISNYATLLSEKNLPEENRLKYVKEIAGTCENFSSMIENILRLNKLENQPYIPRKTMFNLSEQLIQSLLFFENKIEEKNLEIETEFPDSFMFYGDNELLLLVWNNLFSNAVKFSKQNGKIFAGIKETSDSVIVTVADTGTGISEEAAKHIFDRFFQEDTSRKGEGNGLGLALVKKIIDLTESRMEIESEVDAGSRFIISLRKE